MKSSTLSKINHGSDAQSRSCPIHCCPGQWSIAHTTTIKGIKPSIVGPSEDLERAHPAKLPQRVHPHSRGDFLEVKHPVFPGAKCDCSVQDDRLSWQTFIQTVYILPNLLIVLNFENKIIDHALHFVDTTIQHAPR